MSKKKSTVVETKVPDEAREDINTVNVATYAEQAYLDYAMSVVCGRAIPYLEDGQKPVQRRTLYAMGEMRLNPDTKPVKSAKIIGTVLGSYHPHGDQSVYDAMVRQTQSFVMRYPLVHGEGNFGSRDGDGAAAMRYCFVGDTLIHTENGLERIEAMEPKDTKDGQAPLSLNVRSLDGNAQAVKWLFSGYHPTVEVKTSLGFKVKCTANEPLYVAGDSENGFKWKRVDELKMKEMVYLSLNGFLGEKKVELPSKFKHFFETKKDLNTFVGACLSSCCTGVHKNNNVETIQFRFPELVGGDTTLNKLKSLLFTIKGGVSIKESEVLVEYVEGISKVIQIEVESAGLLLLLNECGFINSNKLPDVLLNSNKKEVEALFDWPLVNASHRSAGIHCSKLKNGNVWAEEVQVLALSSGFLLSRKSTELNFVDEEVYISSRNSSYIADAIVGLTINNTLVPVFDLTVENTHAFVANGFVAHNTEAKLSNNSRFLLQDLGAGTVDFRANYDGTTEEPEILPARLPFILMNGAEGVGVGMASSIPPHRAGEVCAAVIELMKDPNASFETVMNHIPGPDFPTGGQLIQSREKILSTYKEGNGTLKLRGRWDVETGARGTWKLVVKELPYGVSSQKMMEQIDALLNPKPKEKGNKKEFTQDQLRLKQMFGGMIDVYRDESDKNQPIRLVFEPKSLKQNPDDLIQSLLAYTSLQDTIKFNLVVVGRDRRPCQKGIHTLLKEWSEFRIDLTRRRLEHEKVVAEKRLHIVQGRIKVIDAIQEAVRIIQTADDPKKGLMDRFDLSEIQATDVLDMRLRQLAKLEGNSLLKEKGELEKTIAKITRLLAKQKELVNLVIEEIETDLKSLGDDPRRTVVEEVAEVDDAGSSKTKMVAKMAEEPITVAVSEKFWVRAKSGHDQAADTFVFKTGDAATQLFNSSTHETLVVMDHTGRVYNMDASEIPNTRGGEGVPLSASFDAQGKFIQTWMAKPKQKYLMTSDAGHGFVAPSEDMMTRMKAGKVMLVVGTDAQPAKPLAIDVERAEKARVFCLSTDGSLVGFALSELPEMGKGKGVALMGLRDGCKIASLAVVYEGQKIGIQEGGKTKWVSEEDLSFCFGVRSSSKKGKKLGKTNEGILIVN